MKRLEPINKLGDGEPMKTMAVSMRPLMIEMIQNEAEYAGMNVSEFVRKVFEMYFELEREPVD